MSGQEPEQRSPAAGACVVVAIVGGAFAVVFAASVEAGILAVWIVGALALVRAVTRRMSESSATPPPAPDPLPGTVYARETGRAREIRRMAGEGYSILPETEYVTDTDV